MTDGASASSPNARIAAYTGAVPLGTKSIYAVGSAAEAIIGVAFNTFNFFFYTNILGLSGTLAGGAITVALVFDAITDPLIGSISDRWRSKLGRRHPFMFAAVLPVMVCLFFIYSPPTSFESTGLFLWLTVLTIIMRSTMTLFHVPHLALGAELSSDFTERTRVMSLNTLIGALGGIAMYILGYGYFFRATPEFSNGLLNEAAYPYFAITASLAGGGIMLLSTVFTLRLIPSLPKAPGNISTFRLREFLRDMWFAMSNRNYMVLLIGYLFLSAMLGTRGTLALHMNTYFWELVPAQILYFALLAPIAPIVGFMVSATLHELYGKKRVFVVAVVLMTIFSAAPVMLRLIGWMPENGSPWLLPSLLVLFIFEITAGIILSISVMSTLADIADEHELNTHRRQEGIFYASRSFFAKSTSGLGHLFAGIAIDVIDFPVLAEPGTVAASKVFQLGLVDGPISAIPGVIAILFYMRFRLTRAQHDDIQRQLMARHRNEPTTTLP